MRSGKVNNRIPDASVAMDLGIKCSQKARDLSHLQKKTKTSKCVSDLIEHVYIYVSPMPKQKYYCSTDQVLCALRAQ